MSGLPRPPSFRLDGKRALVSGAGRGIGLAAAAALAGYHYTLIRGRDREFCFRAFLHNTWFGCAVFAGIAADYAWRLSAWPAAW